MATLLLTTVGSALGGPVGGALGALAGRRIDESILGGPRREGPRLKELQVTTSSYGQPIPWHFGRVRAAGTVIWATDLVEHRETSGGGKGKPKTTSFSYSASFAVALASRPIADVGRIWADGNLLRGAAGDLKTGGQLRIHHGWGDQPPDPLIASAEGTQAPAFRNIAYVVFEDLQLADFGNRIPTLTFEIVGSSGELTLAELLRPLEDVSASPAALAGVQGYSWDGGTVGQVLASIDGLHPILADAGGRMLAIAQAEDAMTPLPLLPEAAASTDDGDFAQLSGLSRRRATEPGQRPAILRYYDIARDYQPGTQRASGRSIAAGETALEFPGTLGADDARALIETVALRASGHRETLAWRTTVLDLALLPGALVAAPGMAGAWRIISWEWRDQGIELELQRHGGGTLGSPLADPGRSWTPPDLALTPTLLRAFELPAQSTAPAETPVVMAAATSRGAGWTGAALYADHGGALTPLEAAARMRAIGGSLAEGLGPSPALRFEALASCTVLLASDDFDLGNADLAALALGQNRLLVGSEVIQFAQAERVGFASWRIAGLLRGRGGTEGAALAGHPAGSAATLLDDRLVVLDGAGLVGANGMAAIGHGDDQPVLAAIENGGLSVRPPTPVHASRHAAVDGSLTVRWVRRARGAWAWVDEVDTPLGEARESYRVGLGPVSTPYAAWEVGEPVLVIDAAARSGLAAAHPATRLWVRQIGTHAQSQPLDLGPIG